MKAIVSFVDLHRTVTAAVTGMDKRTGKPILACVLLDAHGDTLTLTRTDIDIWVRVEFAGALRDGAVAVPAARLLAAIKALAPKGSAARTAQVQLVCDGTALSVSIGGGPDMRLPLDHDAADFPAAPDHDLRTFASMPTTELATIISGVLPAAGRDATVPVLGNVHLVRRNGETYAEATDRYRAHRHRVRQAGHGPDFGVNLPTRVLRLYAKLFRGHVGGVVIADNGADTPLTQNCVIRTADGAIRLVWRGGDTDYPNLAALIPDGGNYGYLDRTPLIRAVKTAAALLDRGMPVALTATAEGIQVTACGDGTTVLYTSTVPADVAGIDVHDTEVWFQHEYLIDLLTASPAETVAWRQSHPRKPAVFVADNWTGLLMPKKGAE